MPALFLSTAHQAPSIHRSGKLQMHHPLLLPSNVFEISGLATQSHNRLLNFNFAVRPLDSKNINSMRVSQVLKGLTFLDWWRYQTPGSFLGILLKALVFMNTRSWSFKTGVAIAHQFQFSLCLFFLYYLTLVSESATTWIFRFRLQGTARQSKFQTMPGANSYVNHPTVPGAKRFWLLIV